MSEITERKAHRLLPDDAETLIRWRNFQTESLVEGLTMGTLLSLYHLSSRWMTLDDWLREEPKAKRLYGFAKELQTLEAADDETDDYEDA